jgi:NAD(P)-dependent dehydrogenase (short-subunit alcohol dehydrogenase family)
MSRRVALVTGSSRGIGASTAIVFARGGWDVVLAARDAQRLEQVAAVVREAGVQALAVAADLGDRKQIETLFEAALQRFNRIDGLVNNAVLSGRVDFLEMSPEAWDEAMAVNLNAPVWCAQHAARQMVKQKSGVIVNVSSVMERQSAGINPAYVVAKGGLQALTRELAVRFGPDGIRVITVTPGDIQTGITDAWAGDTAPWLAHWRDMTPIERAGQPEEVAKLIFYLCGDDAAYITGTEIVIDGGRLAAIYPKSLTKGTL